MALKSQPCTTQRLSVTQGPKLQVSEFYEVKQVTMNLAAGGEQSRKGIIKSENTKK